MIFEEIVLENFGVFRGRQSLELAPKSPDKPLVLIGGLNGGGKTTLLDALQLVLYGKLARCSNRGNLAFDEYIRRCVHRGTDDGEPMALELKFRRLVQGKQQRYAVRRSWGFAAEAPVEDIQVSVDGQPDAVLTETWPEQVEAILPQGISALFFFDGEKIEELAAPESATSVLATALNSLLGLEIVDQLSTDLNVLKRRKLVEVRSDVEKKAIRAEQVTVETLEKMIEEAQTALAGRKNELDRAVHELGKAEEQHQREGGALIERQKAIAEELAMTRSQWDDARMEFWHLAGGASPLGLVHEQLQAILVQATREHEQAEAATLAGTLKARDQQILARLRKDRKLSTAIARLEQVLSEDRLKRRPQKNFKPYLEADTTARSHLSHLLDDVLPAEKKQARDLRELLARLGSTLTTLERKQEALPEKETAANTARRVTDKQAAVARARENHAVAESKLAELRGEWEQKHAALVRLLEKDVDEKVKQADDRRLLDHAARVRKTLEGFREAIVRRHVSRIEALVIECFRQLLHKASLVTEIRIDPQSYTLTLYGGDRQILRPERLSAGERQLLAVALLWGLARAAGRALPTIIDTPLGRLDTRHRRHLIDRYFPFASHQVVLLATDSEMTAEYHRALSRYITREYLLVHDPIRRCTDVTEGFFSY